MAKKLMILGASILQLPAIEQAVSMGLEVVVVDMNPKAIGFNVPNVKKEIISTTDVDAIVKIAKDYNINGIMTLATDMPMRSVAAVATELGLVGIDNQTALRATNKNEMRLALQKEHVPIPKYYKVSNEQEYNEIIKQFSSPYIVKPVDSSGSRGIFAVKDITNIDIKKLAYKYCKPYSGCGDVLVEEYMKGPEVSVETLTVDGICHVIQITDKITTGSPHFVETGHSQPTRLSKEISTRVSEVAIAANKAVGINNGPSHTEIIVTEDGPKVVEIGARLGGDNITTHLVPLSTGVNMVECCIKIALGEQPDIKIKWNKGSAIKYFEQHKGTIKCVNGVDEAKKIPGIKQISIVHGVGEQVTEVNSSGARMGFVISQDEDASKALNDCENALDVIDISYLND